MAAHDYLEDLSSLLPAVTLLEKLGFTYLTQSEQLALRGGRTSKCVLESVLSGQLKNQPYAGTAIFFQAYCGYGIAAYQPPNAGRFAGDFATRADTGADCQRPSLQA